jgi:hypothetical protein
LKKGQRAVNGTVESEQNAVEGTEGLRMERGPYKEQEAIDHLRLPD